MHALLSGTHSGDLWEISDDISFSEISQPCSDPVVVAGVCITSKYFLWNSTGGTYQMDEDWTDVFAENQ